MSKFIMWQKETNTKGEVTLVHNFPEQLPENVKEKGMEVDAIPEYEQGIPMGKMVVLYVNPETRELWYELKDRPLTTEERLELMEQALNDMILNGGASND